MRTTDAVRGRWSEVFQSYGLPPITKGKHYKGPCPLCGKKSKFRIDDKNGTGSWICVCNQGNGFELIKEATGMTFEETCDAIDKIIGNDSSDFTPQEKPGATMQKKTIDHYNRLIPIRGSYAEMYLVSRKIEQLPLHSVRFSPDEYYDKEIKNIPAMYALATDHYNEIVFYHCTYLDRDKKANLEIPRKMFTIKNYEGSISVKMFKPEKYLGIAEGIETSLAAYQITNVKCWSVINATFMKRFRAPAGVEILYIFADNDYNGTGLEAAFTCGRSNIMKKNDVREVHICWPLIPDSDFNDLLLQNNNNNEALIMKWVLRTKN